MNIGVNAQCFILRVRSEKFPNLCAKKPQGRLDKGDSFSITLF